MSIKLFSLLVLSLVVKVENARILGVVPVASYSHQVAFRPIWKELSLRGHQVTVITTNPIQDPTLTNLTEIDISYSYDVLRKHNYQEAVLEFGNDLPKMWRFFMAVAKDLHKVVFKDPNVRNLIDNPAVEFDLVMIEYLSPVMIAFAHRFKEAHFIAISSLDLTYMGHDCLGNPSHPALNPDSFLPFQKDLTFYQRFLSAVFSVHGRFFNTQILRKADKTVQTYFGQGYPPLEELVCKLDMLFVNVNPVFDNIRPVVPAVVKSLRPEILLWGITCKLYFPF